MRIKLVGFTIYINFSVKNRLQKIVEKIVVNDFKKS